MSQKNVGLLLNNNITDRMGLNIKPNEVDLYCSVSKITKDIVS